MTLLQRQAEAKSENKTQAAELRCTYCKMVCKSSHGLSRHIKAKHPHSANAAAAAAAAAAANPQQDSESDDNEGDDNEGAQSGVDESGQGLWQAMSSDTDCNNDPDPHEYG
jgi:uncharacterized C2H2 Zn-finger protein